MMDEKIIEDAIGIIRELMNNLPDSDSHPSECWKWCWDELNGDAQDEVKAIRMKASNFLARV